MTPKLINRWFLFNNEEIQKLLKSYNELCRFIKGSEFCQQNRGKENFESRGGTEDVQRGKEGVEPSAK